RGVQTVRDHSPRPAEPTQGDSVVVTRLHVTAGGSRDDDGQHLLATADPGGQRLQPRVPAGGDQPRGAVTGVVDAGGKRVQRKVVADENGHRAHLTVIVGQSQRRV